MLSRVVGIDLALILIAVLVGGVLFKDAALFLIIILFFTFLNLMGTVAFWMENKKPFAYAFGVGLILTLCVTGVGYYFAGNPQHWPF